MRRLCLLLLIGQTLSSHADAADPGTNALRELDASVQKSCSCAAVQDSGIHAALTCTQDLETFSKIKLDHQLTWTPTQKQRALQIETIVETCLSKALGYRQTLAKLSIAAPFGQSAKPGAPFKTPPYYWLEIPSRKLILFADRLVRVLTITGKSFKGLLINPGNSSLRLKQARSDGGGILEFDPASIKSTSILIPSIVAIERND